MKKPKTKAIELDFADVRSLVDCLKLAEFHNWYVDGLLLDRLEILKEEFEVQK